MGAIRTIVRVLAVAALVAAAVAPASANCLASRLFSQFDPASDLYAYTYLPGALTDPASVVGRFWQPGDRAAHNEGSYDDGQWFVPYGSKMIINGELGSAGVTGCPDGRMICLLQSKTTDGKGSVFAAASVAATPPAFLWYNYALHGNWTTIELPRPRVVVTSYVAGIVTLDFTFPAVEAGNYGDVPMLQVVTGFRLMTWAGPVQVGDGGRDPAAWQFWQRVPYAGTDAQLNGVTFDCNTIDIHDELFFATQLEFDNGQLLGDYVSAATSGVCERILAMPKFKRIDRKMPIGR